MFVSDVGLVSATGKESVSQLEELIDQVETCQPAARSTLTKNTENSALLL